MGELLLELLSEEIPARMQRRTIGDLTGLVRDKLAVAEIPAATIAGYVTPRRLTVIVDGIPATQPDRSEERRGPRVGSPEAAIGGFLRAAGLASIDQCETRGTDRGEFYFAVIRQTGRATTELLPELLLSAITDLPWPKSMRFPAAGLRWVRPLNSVICLFDGVVLPLALGRVPVGRITRGHRFLSVGEVSVSNAQEYLEKLEQSYVVLDRSRRRHLIEKALTEHSAAARLTVKPDEGLLEEVTGLVEYPVVLGGTIDPVFMDLPPEVLSTAMRTHQKYFSCLNPDGTPASRFLFVANNLTDDGGVAIATGNERVLRARLSDARFFWDQDRKIPLADRVDALKDRVFHAKLGSVYDKVERVEKLAAYLVDHLYTGNDGLRERVQRASRLAKADLSTGMVGEFPELQGVMGRYYALYDHEDSAIAEAVADHYKPLGPNDSCPTAPVSVVLALSDKIDTLIAFFAIGEPPTGSRDPFALRRAALGVIRLILENQLRLKLSRVLSRVAEIFYAQQGSTEFIAIVGNELLKFIIDRLKAHLREQGIRHDLISAAFTQPGKVEDELTRLIRRVEALQDFLALEDGSNLLTAYRRASNIVGIEERKEGTRYNPIVNGDLLGERAERALNLHLDQFASMANEALLTEDFNGAMAALASLRPAVDEFFDKVTVNVEDRALRENRLRLLSRIRATMNQIADFSQIEG